MSNAAHTQPVERDRVHHEWTPEATEMRNGIAPDATMLRWGLVSLAEKLARVRSEHCGAFPVRVLPEDMLCALTGYGVTVVVKTEALNAEVSEGGTRDSRIETAAQSRPSPHCRVMLYEDNHV